MSAPTPEKVKQKLRSLVLEKGMSVRAASKRVGVSSATGGRIMALPFDGSPQGPSKAPPINYQNDQTPPAPSPFRYQPGYHDHSYRSFAEPVSYDGFTLARARAAVSMHRQGMFSESYALCIAALGFPPILAALTQRMSPPLSLARRINGGASPLSRLVASELETQIVPAGGLLPSAHYPPTLWGSKICWRAMMGFAVLQHAFGDEDPDTGVRQMYTRLWPNWATQRLPGRRTFQALTTEGPVDITNDGKFTLIADVEDPHLFGAILALAEEALDGKGTERARASYIKQYGNPKWIATGPPNVATHGDHGDALFNAMGTIRNPDGYALIPHGSSVKVEGLTAGQSTTFEGALSWNLLMVALVLLGQDGTMMSGSGGVYSSPTFGKVLHSIVSRDLACAVRGANQGHVAPSVEHNYAASIAEDPDWQAPALEIPLPDPDADARAASIALREESLVKQIVAERSASLVVDQPRVNALALERGIAAPVLAEKSAAPAAKLVLSPTGVEKIARVDEGRASQGLPPVGDKRGHLFIAEIGTTAPAEEEEIPDLEVPAKTATPDPEAEPAPSGSDGAPGISDTTG